MKKIIYIAKQAGKEAAMLALSISRVLVRLARENLNRFYLKSRILRNRLCRELIFRRYGAPRFRNAATRKFIYL